jgi:hypothetical protein
MKRTHSPTLIGIAGGLMIMFAFPVGKVEPAIPTVKVPGAYPYEETVRIPAPDIAESTVVPTPAPFLYREPAPTAAHDSQIVIARPPLNAKAVREAAFKYNGVPEFCGFLAALPADVSVFDPTLGRTRALVKGDRVVRKNVVWFRKHNQARPKSNDRTFVSVEELGMRNSGI